METKYLLLVDRYVNNDLTTSEKQLFEEKLANSPELQAEVEKSRTLQEAIIRKAQRKEVVKIQKSVRFKKIAKVVAVVVVLATALTLGAVYLNKKSEEKIEEIKSVSKEFVVQFEKELAFVNITPEYFEYDGGKALFISKSGVFVSVVENSLLLNGKPFNGEALLQWQEARTSSDIMLAGLNTKSGDKLLETQGMFSFKAFTKSGQELKINDKVGVYVQVPVDELKTGMKLYKAVTKSDGTIDWQEPEELEKLPVLADMKNLDFYPPGFENCLNDLNWKSSKKSRDSLYLSFENYNLVSVAKMKQVSKIDSIPYFTNIDGESLFKNKCSVCHMINKNTTGPKLYRVRQKWNNECYNPELIYTWVNDWEKAAERSEYVTEVSKYSPVSMAKFPELSKNEINAIFDYIDANLDNNSNKHIPPSSVLAMWKPQFNQTNLSTRDFERRMKAIHKTCSKEVFEVYRSGLKEKLWVLDEKVAKMGYKEFQSFADERVGEIEISNAHQRNLERFYSNVFEQLKKEAKSNRDNYEKDYQRFNRKVESKRAENVDENSRRFSRNIVEETSVNLKGINYDVTKGNPKNYIANQVVSSVGFTITNQTAICNIDRVASITASRVSAKVYNTQTNKVEEIRYNPFEFQIEEAEKFNSVFAYFIPEQLSSFQRQPIVAGKVSFPLNGFMKYKLYVIAQKESKFYFYEKMNLKSGNLGKIQLSESRIDFIRARLSSIDAKHSVKKDFSSELDWLKLEQEKQVRETKYKNMIKFRENLYPIVYPCGKYGGHEVAADTLKSEVQIEI